MTKRLSYTREEVLQDLLDSSGHDSESTSYHWELYKEVPLCTHTEKAKSQTELNCNRCIVIRIKLT